MARKPLRREPDGLASLDPQLAPIAAAFAKDGEVGIGRVLSAKGLMVGRKLFAATTKGGLLVRAQKSPR